MATSHTPQEMDGGSSTGFCFYFTAAAESQAKLVRVASVCP